MTLVSSADETAKDVYRILHDRGLAVGGEATPRHRFRATGDSLLFARLGRRFLGPGDRRGRSRTSGGVPPYKGGPYEGDHHRLLGELPRA